MRVNKTRAAALAAAAVTAALALTGCGPTSAEAPSSSDATVVWGVQGGQSDSYEAAAERWNSANPDRPIELQMFGNDGYQDKLRMALGADQGPALMFGWGGGVLDSYVKAGYVDPIEDAEITDRYLDTVKGAVTFDGKTYGAAINNIQPVVVLYNKDVFASVGAEPPTTWDELLDLVPVFEKAGVAPIALAGASKWPELPYLSYLVDRLGGSEVFDAILAGEEDAWSDPAVTKAVEMIQELVKAGGFNADYASVDYGSGAADALLYSGKAAMMVVLSQAYSNIQSSAPDFVASGALGYVPFPAVDGGSGDPATIVGNPSNFWSVTSAASNDKKKTALDFLKTEVMNEKYVGEILDRSAVPGVKSAADLIAERDDNEFQSFVFDLAQNAPTFQLSWDQALSPAQGAELTTQLDRVFLLEIDADAFAEAMNATIG
jgi:raffinose/stachyose/melibiose transport system substrate-binding protein